MSGVKGIQIKTQNSIYIPYMHSLEMILYIILANLCLCFVCGLSWVIRYGVFYLYCHSDAQRGQSWITGILFSDEGRSVFNRFLPIVLATFLIDGTNDLKISNQGEEGSILAHRVVTVSIYVAKAWQYEQLLAVAAGGTLLVDISVEEKADGDRQWGGL